MSKFDHIEEAGFDELIKFGAEIESIQYEINHSPERFMQLPPEFDPREAMKQLIMWLISLLPVKMALIFSLIQEVVVQMIKTLFDKKGQQKKLNFWRQLKLGKVVVTLLLKIVFIAIRKKA